MTPRYGVRYPNGFILPIGDMASAMRYAETCAWRTEVVVHMYGLWASSRVAPSPEPRTEGTAERPHVVDRPAVCLPGGAAVPFPAVAS